MFLIDTTGFLIFGVIIVIIKDTPIGKIYYDRILVIGVPSYGEKISRPFFSGPPPENS